MCKTCAATGGELIVGPEAANAYETGHGSVLLRATAHVEYEGSKRKKKQAAAAADADAAAAAEAAEAAAAGGKALIVFTEMPYQVCKVGVRSRTPARLTTTTASPACLSLSKKQCLLQPLSADTPQNR
jgi:hypothetical protein